MTVNVVFDKLNGHLATTYCEAAALLSLSTLSYMARCLPAGPLLKVRCLPVSSSLRVRY
jgi:hypothetical protein